MGVRVRLAAAGAALVVTFLRLGYLVRPRVPHVDVLVHLRVHSEPPAPLGRVAALVSTVLSPNLLWAALAVLVLAAGHAWWRRRRREADLLLRASVLLLACWATVSLKVIFRRPRPGGNTGWSFPSGHVTAVTAVGLAAVLLCVWLAVRWYVAVLVLAVIAVLLTALSRVILGVHYFTDVVGAAIGTAGVGLLVAAVLWPATDRVAPTVVPTKPPARQRDPLVRPLA